MCNKTDLMRKNRAGSDISYHSSKNKYVLSHQLEWMLLLFMHVDLLINPIVIEYNSINWD